MPDTREKLIELLDDIQQCGEDFTEYEIYGMRLPNTVCNDDVADHLIANGVTIQRWIPVTERLPKQGQEVIVYDGGVLKPKVYAYLFWSKDYDNWARVTHWMPLPEPPKEEE